MKWIKRYEELRRKCNMMDSLRILVKEVTESYSQGMMKWVPLSEAGRPLETRICIKMNEKISLGNLYEENGEKKLHVIGDTCEDFSVSAEHFDKVLCLVGAENYPQPTPQNKIEQGFLWQQIQTDLNTLRGLVAGGYTDQAKDKESEIKSKYFIIYNNQNAKNGN